MPSLQAQGLESVGPGEAVDFELLTRLEVHDGDRHVRPPDDETFTTLYVPPGLLHGFQALTEQTDVCYRIDREHDPAEDMSVRYDDPELRIDWPLPVSAISGRDLSAGSWARLRERLRGTDTTPPPIPTATG